MPMKVSVSIYFEDDEGGPLKVEPQPNDIWRVSTRMEQVYFTRDEFYNFVEACSSALEDSTL